MEIQTRLYIKGIDKDKESEYNGQGQPVADIDESGENRTEYEYIPGTNVVRSQKLPNGSKFSYGHDIDDTVTSITQSTDDGEGNSTQTAYTCGLPTQHISGNNKVRYSYDHKRRVKTVNLNGVEYIKNTYTDGMKCTPSYGQNIWRCISSWIFDCTRM